MRKKRSIKKSEWEIDRLISRALQEDIGKGDITTEIVIPKNKKGKGIISHKGKDGVVSGLEIVRKVFLQLNPFFQFQFFVRDGEEVRCGMEVAIVRGNARALLMGERTALNFLGHLSGIATLTNKFVRAVSDWNIEILDTRKTLPGLRKLEKKAVVDGGGKNHRMGLYDAILVKNNHIALAGNITTAIQRIKKCKLPILCEVRSNVEAEEAVRAGASGLLLDNLSASEVRELAEKWENQVRIEVSGGISLENIGSYCCPGISAISIGALTHSAPALDFAFQIYPDD